MHIDIITSPTACTAAPPRACEFAFLDTAGKPTGHSLSLPPFFLPMDQGSTHLALIGMAATSWCQPWPCTTRALHIAGKGRLLIDPTQGEGNNV